MWYEDTTQYVIEDGLAERSWPANLGLVHVYNNSNGDTVTTSGWNERQFMENHELGKFEPEKYLRRFQSGRAFGIIMRTVPYICVDIDGKNGGIQASKVLMLPPTLAETSKSGNGYHLFYRIPDATWHDQLGYAEYPDALGIIPGVDIKSTGVVYHYPQQRWNNKQIATLPPTLKRLMDAHKQSRLRQMELTAAVYTGEDAEIHAAEVKDELLRWAPKEGGRNSWLFAWGCRAARYIPTWPSMLEEAGIQAGLSAIECSNIVRSVLKYGIGDS